MSQPPHKKRKTNPWSVANFQLSEAQEVAEDQSDEEDYSDHHEEVDNKTLEALEQKALQRRNKRIGKNGSERSRRDALTDFIETLKNRYGQSYADNDEQSVDEPKTDNRVNRVKNNNNLSISQSNYPLYNNNENDINYYENVEAAIPTVNDPKLWLVPCVFGKERSAVMELLKKFFKYANHPIKRLFINTAFTTDQNTGHIYVEAAKEIHVRRACEGIFGLNSWKISLVPINEMVATLTVRISGPEVYRGQWCRFTRGLYKGDLAQVFAVLDQGSSVVVRVMPRIDYANLSLQLQRKKFGERDDKNNTNNYVRPRGHRPPARLFNIQELIDMGFQNQIEQGASYLRCRVDRFKNRKYKNGYLLHKVDVSYLNFEVAAMQDEVAKLQTKIKGTEDEENSDDDLFKVPPPVIPKSCDFVRGDTVKVISGSLINLIGSVLTTQPNPIDGKIIVSVLPEHKDLRDSIDFPAEELQKYFKIGCHVKCTKGPYKDETGLIVKVDEGNSEVVVFSDLTSRQLRVNVDDITETSEVSTGRDVYGNYALYELVALSRDVVGVIVDIQIGTFTILDNKAQLQSCRLQDITRHTKDLHAVALDIDNSQIRISDVVIPQLGDYKGQRATVKHIYRAVLFCHCKSCTNNAGIFVIRSRLCRLAGGRIKSVTSSHEMPSRIDTNNINNKAKTQQKARFNKDPWMGKTVKIIKGSWKGYIGIVKACSDTILRVELHAKFKIVNVKREDVKVTNPDGSDNSIDYNNRTNQDLNKNEKTSHNFRNNRGNNDRYGSGAETPLIGVRTPAYGMEDSIAMGARTPAIGSFTPAHDSQPNYGGRTPAHGNPYGDNSFGSSNNSAWNPGAATPYIGSGGLSSRSPAYGYGYNSPALSTFNQSVVSDIRHSNEHHSSPYNNNINNNNNNSNNNMISSSNNNNNNSNMISSSSNNNNNNNNNNNTINKLSGQNSYSHSAYDDAYSSADENTSHHGHNINNNDNDNDHNNDLSDSNSGSESVANVETARATDPYYFVVPGAELTYNNTAVKVLSCDHINQTVRILLLNGSEEEIEVSRSLLQPRTPQDKDRVMVVFGRLQGELGDLIGIDRGDAIVQMDTTQEVAIMPYDLVVKFLN